jgi:hypothetical protein
MKIINKFFFNFFLLFYNYLWLKKILILKNIRVKLYSLINYKIFIFLFIKDIKISYLFKNNFWKPRKLKKIYKLFFFNKFNSQLIFFNFNNIVFNNLSFNKIFNPIYIYFLKFFQINYNFKEASIYFLDIYKRTFGEGFFYIRGLFIIFFIDASITDDEPLWEPIEWSLIQIWILFIFIFAWIVENLITSRYGNYTGRDKRIWFAWYKSFWFIDLIYIISYGLAVLIVIIPFYFELTYTLPFILNWWNWYTRVFFFKFISIFTIILLISHILQLNIRWLNWKKLIFFIIIINLFIGYLLYSHFIMTFFGYFTDPIWHKKTRAIDYIQLSHEPLKWAWDISKRDHFSYHKVNTVFWFKNDGQFAGAFLIMHIFFFFSIFFIYLYWITLLRRIYTTKEITYTFTIFCISTLKQFYYFFFILYLFIIISFIICYWRFPIEFLWIINSNSWILNFLFILKDYFFFILNIF